MRRLTPPFLWTARLTRRAGAQDGFTMIVALGVLLVTSLMCAAAFTAVQGDARVTTADTNGKQAYAAAEAGIQAYLYQLNSNSSTAWWETCANDTSAYYPSPVTVPGSTIGAGYAYTPVSTCSSSNPIGTLIDSAGNLRLAVTGTSGSSSRTLIASFRTTTPLSYLWYTVHETLDPAADANCPNNANLFYWNETPGQIPTECQLNWTTGDVVNGSLYTQDQLLVQSGASPSFQNVTSGVNSSDPNQAWVGGNKQNATVSGSVQTVGGGATAVQLPPNNANLLSDAQAHGLVLTGTVNITLSSSSSTQTVTTCPTSSSCVSQSVNLATTPIIYAQNSTTSTCNTTYSPNDVTYTSSNSLYYGPCGDIYVQGSYANSLTLAAANDIVLTGSLLNSTDSNGTTTPTGAATAGLVANQYVRVAHAATISSGTCNQGSASNPNVTIDAAILTLAHSFFVDNFDCGNSNTGTLTVHGAIAQQYRGAVGVSINGTATGYLKSYNYDSRLGAALPPYLFDLQNTTWSVLRETLCSSAAGACGAAANTGSGSGTAAGTGSSTVTPPAGLFTAANGLSLWLDGADPSTQFSSSTCTGAAPSAGAAVGCWKDKSPVGENVTATGSSQPTLGSLNGLGAINFTNPSQVLTAINGNDTYQTVFLVLQLQPSANGWEAMFGSAGNDFNVREYYSGQPLTSNGRFATPNGQDWAYGTGSPALDWSNGVQDLDPALTVPTIISDQSASPQTMTASISNTFYGRGMVGSVGEVIAFNTTLSTAQRRSVEDYLSQKWGVPITPDPLAAPTATAGAQSASVAWSGPAYNGGSAVTGYTVTAAPGGATCSTGGVTSCQVTGLTTGTSYSFTVTATNSVGTGASSASSSSVTAG